VLGELCATAPSRERTGEESEPTFHTILLPITLFSASYLLLNTIQANDVASKGLVFELHCADNVETGLP
jgi:hypothetical protein